MKKKLSFVLVLSLLASNSFADDQTNQAIHFKELMQRALDLSKSKTGIPGGASSQQTMPSTKQMTEAMDKAATATAQKRLKTNELVERAYVRQTEGAAQLNTAAATAARTASTKVDSIDPAEIAKLYKTPSMNGELTGPKDELLVFVSTSIPAETLKVIGTQAKRSGAVLVLRGVAGGFNGVNLRKTMQLMRPAMEQGADVQINPELFLRYGVKEVPTTVLSSAAGKGCDEGFCTQHVALVGDVTIEYALEEFARRHDDLGRIAESRLDKLRGASE